MRDLKMSPAQDQTSQTFARRETYAPPTITVIPLKIEEAMLGCIKTSHRHCQSWANKRS